MQMNSTRLVIDEELMLDDVNIDSYLSRRDQPVPVAQEYSYSFNF